jgi:lysophospholipase L1-like esterase
VDFDKVMQDENDPNKIPAHLTEEGLHPSVQGAKVLAKTFYDKFVK